MENYIVSARKYRPATFDTVVGQRALTTTLKNAIANQSWHMLICFAVHEESEKQHVREYLQRQSTACILLPMEKHVMNVSHAVLSTNSVRITFMSWMPHPITR